LRELLITLRGDKKQEEIAIRLGISQQYLSEIERNAKNPSIRLMRKFQEEYKRSMIELFPDIFLDCNTTK
jgi:transcriptional regulator with XRE-family HTH domain